jgi:hypothetical protein
MEFDRGDIATGRASLPHERVGTSICIKSRSQARRLPMTSVHPQRFMLVLVALATFVAAASSREDVKLAAAAGLEQPCAADGICNAAVCKDDPDCANPPVTATTVPTATIFPAASVDTPCGGRVNVQASDSPLGAAAITIELRYPDFSWAQKAKMPSFIDAHPSGAFATNHGELKGFGVTMVRGTRSNVMADKSGSLTDPTLLFFDRRPKQQDDWKIIGMGYSFALRANKEKPPEALRFAAADWWIHEAGYHHSPGDGGFTCAADKDLKNSVAKAGKHVDAAGCFGIGDDDIVTREFHLDKKHGRYWALHVWFEPKTGRPTIAKTDPWCRQSADAVSVPSCAFFRQGGC